MNGWSLTLGGDCSFATQLFYHPISISSKRGQQVDSAFCRFFFCLSLSNIWLFLCRPAINFHSPTNRHTDDPWPHHSFHTGLPLVFKIHLLQRLLGGPSQKALRNIFLLAFHILWNHFFHEGQCVVKPLNFVFNTLKLGDNCFLNTQSYFPLGKWLLPFCIKDRLKSSVPSVVLRSLASSNRVMMSAN